MARPQEDDSQPTSISLQPIGTAGSESHLRADAIANRELILATAESLFDERGVAAVTMADIAEAAGVGKGTLYRRFANKAELSLALMDAQMAEFQENTMARLRQWTSQELSPLEQLALFLGALVQFVEIHSPLLCEVEGAGLMEGDSTQSLPYFWQYLTIRGLLRAAVRGGEIPPDLDIDYLADALLAPLRVELFRYQRRAKGYSLERIEAGLRAMVDSLRVAT